jgi:hypothetical protein
MQSDWHLRKATMAASATSAGLPTAVTDDQVILDPLPPATSRAIDRSASGREDDVRR